ncbi:hypothetical protein [Chengkuizengella axinellae]|uniref:Uncharacterized protein n=1 Tax=Chengkuizengella axinellae TaxID=3064388 RepID=A0ABT9IYD9_9BACL|nr:hypothetical protein [Chengkuizengella sp. 2205SS18-9]MDP5274273.1 hypothetical protein [Chengkuizengella sp. 2205SS18-9]
MEMYLYHYYEKSQGPFKSLSDLNMQEAEQIQNLIRKEGTLFASNRSENYIQIRFELEALARRLFIKKGGKPVNKSPHYMTLGACPWIKTWYVSGEEIKINVNEFEPKTISFTYGDLFPTMRFDDDKSYRKMIYTLEEIEEIIEIYGLPQEWNEDGAKGPERYIEVQIWDHKPLTKYENNILN